MKKITLDDFKKNTVLIIITIVLAYFGTISQFFPPKNVTLTEAVISSLIIIPLIALWFMAFWNRILTKIFSFKEISYGVAFVLISGLILIL